MDLKDTPFASYKDFMLWQADHRTALIYKRDQAITDNDTFLAAQLNTEIAEIDNDFKQLKQGRDSEQKEITSFTTRS